MSAAGQVRRHRRIALPILALLFVSGLASSANATEEQAGLPVDIQKYAATQGVDPYQADPTSLHVSVSLGSETTRSYARVAFDRLGAGAKISGATLDLIVTSKSAAPKTAIYETYNVSPETAIIQACVLTEPLTEDFDPAAPPAFDCAQGSATGSVLEDGTWRFDLTALLAFWHTHGNTGLALVPVIAEPQASWAVSFLTTSSAAGATYTGKAIPTVSPTPSPTPSVTTPPVTEYNPGSGLGSITPPVSVPPPVAIPTPAPVVAAPPITEAVPVVDAVDDAPAQPWLVIGAGLLLALGGIAVANRGVLATKLVAPVMLGFRAHPAPYALATAALLWTGTFAVYTVAQRPAEAAPAEAAPLPGTVTTIGPGGEVVASNGAPVTIPTVGAAGTTPAGAPAAPAGSAPAGSAPAPGQEVAGPGTWRTISGVEVFFPTGGGVPVAKLYDGAEDVRGISASEITLCAHAATTYGDAFNITPDDLNAYWTDVNSRGGINGRQVNVSYENDNYDPGTAVQAAQACMDKRSAFIIGGIGWDQTPAVRQWAEQNKQLYFHNSAVQQGSEGLRYSFSFGAPVEQFGHWFAQIVKKAYPGKKVAVLWRQSPNWQPARDVFLADAQKLGITVVADYPVQINQANYNQELLQARNAGAEVVFALENSLTSIEMIKQAQAQNWHPGWAIVGANIVTNTLGDSALDQPLVGTSLLDYYLPGYYGGGYAAVAKEIKEFEALYARVRPNADLAGPGGDILYSNWEGQRAMADLLATCGPDCTRNKLAGILLSGYHKEVRPLCGMDFRGGDHHWGMGLTQYVQAFRAPNGRIGWQVVERCRRGF